MVFTDCWSQDIIEVCQRLTNASAMFQAIPHLSKVRLGLSAAPLPPLTVYLQTGECHHTCEGGSLQPCETFIHHFNWQNVSSEILLPNCSPRHFCCITAAIGECCSVYTNTTYMEEYLPHSHYSDTAVPLNTILLYAFFLAVFWAFGLYFIRLVFFDHKKPLRLEEVVNTQNTKDSQSLYQYHDERPVILLYIQEPNGKLFCENLKNLKSFFTHTAGLKVMDIYEEEGALVTNGPDWFKRHNAQLVLIDSVSCRGLRDGGHTLSVLQQNVMYILDWVTRCQLHNRLFVVSFQPNENDVSPVIVYGVTRSYVFPTQKHRLAQDLMVTVQQ